MIPGKQMPIDADVTDYRFKNTEDDSKSICTVASVSSHPSVYTQPERYIEPIDSSIISVISNTTIKDENSLFDNGYPALGSRSVKPSLVQSTAPAVNRDPTNPWKNVSQPGEDSTENPWSNRNKTKPRKPSDTTLNYSNTLSGGKFILVLHQMLFFLKLLITRAGTWSTN